MTLLIHPGFHKTGTTWLQHEFFSRSDLFEVLYGHHEIDALLVRPHDLDFDADAARSEVQARRDRASEDKVQVISAEDLSGYPFNGGRNSKTNADRLRAVFGDAKILLTVRSQPKMLQSLYMQYLQRGGRMNFTDFAEYRSEPGLFWFDIDHLKFDRLADHYAKLFGADNVIVLPQEHLARARDDYIGKLYTFVAGRDLPDDFVLSAEESKNKSAPVSGVPLIRMSNLMRQAPHNPEGLGSLDRLGRLIFRAGYHFKLNDASAKRRLGEEVSRYASGRFEQSNRALQRYCPVSLEELGYPL